MNELPGSAQEDYEYENRDLLARLSRISDQLDPVPGLSYELGRAAFGFRRIDAELVELVGDSAVDPKPLAAVRSSGADVRLLSFESADLEVDLQVVPRAGRRSLLGQVVGAVTHVRVETPEGDISAAVDQHGRFQVDDAPAGRIRLHVRATPAAFVTSWVTI